MTMHAFVEMRHQEHSWDLLQTGTFPVPTRYADVATKWHQPFGDEDYDAVFFQSTPMLDLGLPKDMSKDLAYVRKKYGVALHEGNLTVDRLMFNTGEYRDQRIVLPDEASTFWQHLRILSRLGMSHRVRLVVWTC